MIGCCPISSGGNVKKHVSRPKQGLAAVAEEQQSNDDPDARIKAIGTVVGNKHIHHKYEDGKRVETITFYKNPNALSLTDVLDEAIKRRHDKIARSNEKSMKESSEQNYQTSLPSTKEENSVDHSVPESLQQSLLNFKTVITQREKFRKV
jgi:hypothetical protein